MAVEAWFRNPHNYIRELAEVGYNKVVWDRGILIKKRVDPMKHAKLFFGDTSDFRLLLIGPQGTAELDRDHDINNPKAVYPTWDASEDISLLEEMIAFPIGMDESACSDMSVVPDERPVFGQEHRVIIANPPNANLTSSRSFYRTVSELAEEYPSCILHLHGSYSWRVMFGMGFKSAAIEPREAAAGGKIIIPAGKIVLADHVSRVTQWVHLLGMRVSDMKVPRNRCMYNIRSAIWASENWNNDLKFKVHGPNDEVDYKSSDSEWDRPLTKSPFALNIKPKAGDKITCDECSLAVTCKYFRVGSVCTLPGTSSSELAKAFQSRDSSKIIDGLGALLAKQTERAERAVEWEDELGGVDKEVTGLLHQIFTDGVTLAKLLDPNLRGGTKVQVNVGSAKAIEGSTPNAFVAQIVADFEAQGIPREAITIEMIKEKMSQLTVPAEITQGEVVRHDV